MRKNIPWDDEWEDTEESSLWAERGYIKRFTSKQIYILRRESGDEFALYCWDRPTGEKPDTLIGVFSTEEAAKAAAELMAG